MAVDQYELTSWPVHPADFSLYLAVSLSIAIGLPSEGHCTEVSVRTARNNNGRDDWIRTSGLTHPKGARYQAAPRPERTSSVSLAFEKGQDRAQFLAHVQQRHPLLLG